MSLPDWPGAEHCYGRAYRLLEQWNSEAYRAQRTAWKRKTGFRYAPPESAIELARALAVGNEESIKGLLLHHDTMASLPPLARPRT